MIKTGRLETGVSPSAYSGKPSEVIVDGTPMTQKEAAQRLPSEKSIADGMKSNEDQKKWRPRSKA